MSGDAILYAVGDIHGRQDLLTRLLTKIGDDIAASGRPARVIFLGDYIDRGDNSKGVLETLTRLSTTGRDCIFLRGNHEEVMLNFLDGQDDVLEDWMHFGGATTLGSYSIAPSSAVWRRGGDALREQMHARIPVSHITFLRGTTFSYEAGDYLFAHAGVDPTKTIARQTPEDFMWSRRNFLRHTGPYGKKIIYGHTIHAEPEVTPYRIGIDTGAYASGCLTCVRLAGDEHRFITT